MLGGLIFFATKSVFLLLIPLIFLILVRAKRVSQAIWFLLVPLFLVPSIVSASSGGRSSFNLAIQASKSTESIDEIVACVPYYFSYPVGKMILPSYEGVCHQNDPSPSMPRYLDNPYVVAAGLRSRDYSLSTWFSTVITHPLTYPLVVVVSLANIVLIEGIYPTILTTLPLPLMALGYLFAKLVLSLYLWLQMIRSSRHRSWLWLVPLHYFAAVVGNYPVEPRYFYPLLPYLYFLAGRDPVTSSVRKGDNHQSA